MNFRFVGVLLSLIIIVCAVISLIFVAKITQIGGPGYSWEYIPPIVMLIFGLALLAYWIYRIIITR